MEPAAFRAQLSPDFFLPRGICLISLLVSAPYLPASGNWQIEGKMCKLITTPKHNVFPTSLFDQVLCENYFLFFDAGNEGFDLV